jgi:hypothetical protein
VREGAFRVSSVALETQINKEERYSALRGTWNRAFLGLYVDKDELIGLHYSKAQILT